MQKQTIGKKVLTHTDTHSHTARVICIDRCAHRTCLENHFLAADAGSFQVNEGSHLLGPGMLGDEAVAGLKDDNHGIREERTALR